MMDWAAEDRSDLRRWMLSGAAVLFLTSGGAAALAIWRPSEDVEAAEPSGAIVFELAPLSAAPAANPTDIAPGPEQVMSEAQPVSKPDVTPPDDTPEVPPAANPEATLPAKVEPPPDLTPPQQMAVATNSAPSAVPEHVAPVAVAPTQGQPNTKNSEAVVTWRTQLVALIEKNKRYPQAAQSRREQGTAQVSFTLDRKGMVADARVTQSSGSDMLDAEAIALLRRAQPFPAPPASFSGNGVVVRLPIQFTVK